MTVARVLIDTPLPQLDRLFDYAVPESLRELAKPGVRVTVPLRSASRLSPGFIVDIVEEAGEATASTSANTDGESSGSPAPGASASASVSAAPAVLADSPVSVNPDALVTSPAGPVFPASVALSELESVVSVVPVLTPEVWQLARRVADRQAGSASDVLRLAIPKRMVRAEKAWLATPDEARLPSGLVDGGRGSRIASLGARVPAEQGIEVAPIGGTGCGGLGSRPAVKGDPRPPAPPLAAVVAEDTRLAWRSRPGVVQLSDGEWVGAWAVELAEAASRCLASGRTAILATADYRDEDQLRVALLAQGVGESLAVLSARQTASERYTAFLGCLGAAPRIVLGNRSVVYAPAENLGLIALFDDGDPLFAEPLAPYAHARDVALLRQQQQGGALVFAGLSRSVEVQRLVEIGWMHDGGRPRSSRVIPTVLQPGESRTAHARIPSTAWEVARAALGRGPVLVQVASPGYASFLACANCRAVARCGHCQGPLALSGSSAPPRCRWCGAVAASWVCPECGGQRLRMSVPGSVRTAEELGRAFPGIRVIVSDGQHLLGEVSAKPALVVATRGAEPLAPAGYRAVLLLDGDRMLQREALGVADDCLRWWSRATALAADDAPAYLVGVGGALAQALALWQQPRWASEQLRERRELSFPPAVRVASVTGTSEAVAAALDSLTGVPVRDILGPVSVMAGDSASIGSRASQDFGMSDSGTDVSTDGDVGKAVPNPTTPPTLERLPMSGLVRALVRFDYRNGDAVAGALRAAIIKAASGSRRPPRPAPGGRPRRTSPALKVRFDDPTFL